MFKIDQLLKKHTKKVSEPNTAKRIFILIILLCFFSSIYISINSFSEIKNMNNENLIYKYLFDMLNLMLILITFIMLQITEFLFKKSYLILNIGLFLWGSALFATVYNDIDIQPVWVSLWILNILKTIGILLLVIGMITAIKKINKKCTYFKMLATIDDLTELPNRRYFHEELKKHENKMLFFIMMDIDNFKKINDKYGHEEGDRILHSFGKVLLLYSEQNVFSARLGGDEFAAFIISNEKENAICFSEYLLNEIKKIIINDSEHMTLSIGMAYKLPFESNEIGFQRADKALYKAKSNNRNRFEWA